MRHGDLMPAINTIIDFLPTASTTPIKSLDHRFYREFLKTF